MQQVAVRAVQLDAVEAGADRPAGRLDELVAHDGELGGGQRVRHGVRLLAVLRVHLAVDGDGARARRCGRCR